MAALDLTGGATKSNGGRWLALGVIVFVVGAFISAYTFISTNFVSRREYDLQLSQSAKFVSREEFDQVREEQKRRTPIVFGYIETSKAELAEIKRRLDRIEALLIRERTR